jgi:hypothetical protein
MLASKIICNDIYSNKSWVSYGMFALQEIGQMVREICSDLERQLNVDPSTLRDFESRVRHDFAGPGPPNSRTASNCASPSFSIPLILSTHRCALPV